MPRLKAWKWDAWADERFEQFLADEPDVVAVDVETPGTAYYDTPFCATLSWRGADGSMQNAYIALDDELGGALENYDKRVEILRVMLERASVWVFHNAKFDLQKLELVGALPEGWQERVTLEDTQSIYYLLDENGRKGLKDLAVRVLKWDDTILVPYKTGKKKGQMKAVAREKHVLDRARRQLGLKAEDGYYYLPREVVVPYAMRDTEFTLLLFEKLREHIAKRELEDVYAREIDLVHVFLRLEGNGFALNNELLDQLTSEWGTKVMEAYTRVQEVAPGVSPDSPKQLLPALKERGHRVEDTKEKTLEKLDDDLARAILEYRKAKKLHTTYLVALQREQRDGIVHPWFNITGARTGRMSSGAAHE